jgi:uncharacterized protein YkwD
MSKLPVTCVVALSLSLLFAPSLVSAQAVTLQDSAAVFQILSGINSARVANGLTPYALNPLLMQAAQAHSEYQRDTGQITHDGPGGTRALDRVLAVGYPAARANENIYAGMGEPGDAVKWWLGSTAGHVQNIMHEVMREVGIGVASSSDGMTYYTVVFSAQPNVLPIFVNNDANSTNSPVVTLALTNEGIFSGSSGGIGRATHILVSNTPDFADAVPQPWAQYVDWTLDTSTGDSLDTNGGGVAVAPTMLPTAPPQPTAIAPQPVAPIPQPTETPTVMPTPSPTGTSISTEQITPTPTRYGGNTRLTLTPVATTTSRPAVLGIPTRVLRTIFWGALGVGLGFIFLGNLALYRSRRRTSELQRGGDDAED